MHLFDYGTLFFIYNLHWFPHFINFVREGVSTTNSHSFCSETARCLSLTYVEGSYFEGL